MPARVPGLYGRRKPDHTRPALDFSKYLTGEVPGHPDQVDYLAAMDGGWKLLGNGPDDSVFLGFPGCGDCEPVRWANTRRMVTKVLSGTEVYPDWDQVLALYRTQNPDFDPHGDLSVNGPGSPADGGMDTQTLLEHLVNVGGPDGVKAVCFGKIPVSNVPAVKAAVANFGYVWTDVDVLGCNQQEFADFEPWDYEANSAVDGGHAVLAGGYPTAQGTESGSLSGDIDFETWAEETSFTDAYWAHEVEQVWVVIWPEHLGTEEFLAGVDVRSLAADFEELTGKPFPAPVPPAPAPVPAPAPSPAPIPEPTPSPESLLAEFVALVRLIAASADRDIAEALAWATTHGL